MSAGMKALYNAVKILTSQPECNDCRLCEENVGLVYLLGNEGKKIPIKTTISETSGGVRYFKRTEDGWCPHFDKNSNRCGIYADRPLCCRLYPLDLMKLDGEVWWVAHMECPIFKRFLKSGQVEVLTSMTIDLEESITAKLVSEWLREDSTSQVIEAFARQKPKIRKLRRFGLQGALSQKANASHEIEPS